MDKIIKILYNCILLYKYNVFDYNIVVVRQFAMYEMITNEKGTVGAVPFSHLRKQYCDSMKLMITS